MNESKWEPPAEMVEALAKELHEAYQVALPACSRLTWDDACYPTQDGRKAQARFVLRRQHERERGLLKAMHDAMRMMSTATWPSGLEALNCALAAHAKLDAPKVPTHGTLFGVRLTEVGGLPDGTMILATSRENYVVLKAAVEREEKR